jgi:general secretion pathway protein A
VATASALVLVVVTLGLFGLPHLGGEWLLPKPRYDSEAVADAAGQPDSGVTPPVNQAGPEPLAPTQNQAESPVAVGFSPVARDEAVSDSPTEHLDESWLDDQNRQAWQSIANLWLDRAAANDIQAACEGRGGQRYSCLREHGSLARVGKLGLPVLLVLHTPSPRYLLLRGFTESGLLVGNAADPLEVGREAVENRWLGEFVLPWPQARDWPAEIRRGEAGSAVDIVLEMATFAEPPWSGGSEFDEQFESWLISFQRRHGLKPDGIVGRVTLLYLLAPTISHPRLITTVEENS